MIYKHVLYAVDINTDFSTSLERVITSSKQTNTKITIAYFLKSFTSEYSAIAAAYAVDNLEENLLKEADHNLKEILKKYDFDEDNIIVEDTTNVKVSIIEKAEALKVDAIFVNGNEHNIISRLGSVAEYVTNNSKCDVVVLKCGNIE